MVVMMSVWTGYFLGGFAGQSSPSLQLNWHPLLLTISLIYLYGNGILIYRIGRNERKNRLKVAHAIGDYWFLLSIFTKILLIVLSDGLRDNPRLFWHKGRF